LFILLVISGDASVLDWIWGGSQEPQQNASHTPIIGYFAIVKVLLEISIAGEKILQEGKKKHKFEVRRPPGLPTSCRNSLTVVNVITCMMAIFIRLKQYEFLKTQVSSWQTRGLPTSCKNSLM
jgi:hypothetical protein